MTPSDRHEEEHDEERGVFPGLSKASRDAAPYLALGLQLAATVVLMFLLGSWVDREFGTEPWIMLAGLLVGIAAGLYNFFRTIVILGNRKGRGESRKE